MDDERVRHAHADDRILAVRSRRQGQLVRGVRAIRRVLKVRADISARQDRREEREPAMDQPTCVGAAPAVMDVPVQVGAAVGARRTSGDSQTERGRNDSDRLLCLHRYLPRGRRTVPERTG